MAPKISTNSPSSMRIGLRRTKVRKIVWIIAIVIILLLLVCAGISMFVGWKLTHKEKSSIETTPASYGLAYQEIKFKSRGSEHQENLVGWYLPASDQSEKKSATIILAHGYGENRLQDNLPALEVAKSMTSHGYNMVLFDFRASGESSGSLISLGDQERFDLLGAADWVREHVPEDQLVLLGYSMGASTSLLAAAEDPSIAAVIADSPFNHMENYLKNNLSHWSGLPNFPFTPLILTLLPPVTGVNMDDVRPIEAVERIYPRPILFIHSKDDEAIPYTESESMARKHPDAFELWLTDDAPHVGTFARQQDVYIHRILEFLDRALK